MRSITRHDLALLFIRALAVFALYAPFLMLCTLIANSVMSFLFGAPMAPDSATMTFTALWFLLPPRLLAAFLLWRFAPPIARLIASPSATPVDTPAPSAPRVVAAGPVHR